MLQPSQNVVARSVCARCALRSHLNVLRQERLKQPSARDKRLYASIASERTRSTQRHTPFLDALGQNRTAARDSRGPSKSKQEPPGLRNIVRYIDRKGQTLDQKHRNERSFANLVRSRLELVEEELEKSPLLAQIVKEAKQNGEENSKFKSIWKTFVQKINSSTENDGLLQARYHAQDERSVPLYKDLLASYRRGGLVDLDARLKYHFYGHITGGRFSKSDILNQQSVADLRYPTEWFPATRVIPRTIHLHVGPTNSGKTYHALQRLETAQRGVYAGPLRLLAHEVFMRLNAKGRKCSLCTGDERRVSEGSDGTKPDDLMACTVEMMPLNTTLDVAVIDEIQMINNEDRGWAWTQALLGVKAKEVHLCGEDRTVPLIRDICASLGEKLVIHRYQRLSPLKVADSSLDGDFTKLTKGDCVVSFSVMNIHALRRQIQAATGRNVAIVYGSLPPETRAQQARLFNDPDNDYDYLVASDAVGMGLNLSIKRIIFETSSKFNGVQREKLAVADVKQIAGRAGRYRTAAQVNEKPTSEQDIAAAKGDAPSDSTPAAPVAKDENVGIVTTLENSDFFAIQEAMASEPDPIKAAGIQPPPAVIARFASYFPPGTPYSYILARLYELSRMHPRFYLCRLKDQLWIADLIEQVEELTILDRTVFTAAPASKTDIDLWRKLMPAYARCVAFQTGGNIADIQELPLEILEQTPQSSSREYLRALEQLHKGVVTYLWLSYRFAGIFTTRPLAFHIKGIVEERIEETLASLSYNKARKKMLTAQMEMRGSAENLEPAEVAVVGGGVEASAPMENGSGGKLSRDTSASDEEVIVDDRVRFESDREVEFVPDNSEPSLVKSEAVKE